jgi:hypothetical protein
MHLIADHIARLPGAWFFVDVPLGTGSGRHHGIELGLQRQHGASADEQVKDLLQSAIREGLTTTTGGGVKPLVLQRGLFPCGVVPSFYPEALAIGSARAADMLAQLRRASALRASVAMVRQELALTYEALIPRAEQRWTAMRWHADWLEWVDGERNAVDDDPGSTDEFGNEADLPVPATAAYVALRRRMGSQISRLQSVEEDPPMDGAMMRAALLARLAHTQVVRLWGPRDPQNLRREAALLRSLAP